MVRILVSLFLAGVFFASGPCLASCGPVLVSYIAGTGKNLRRAFVFYTIFSISRVFVYCLLGLVVFAVGSFAAEELFPGYVSLIGGLFIAGIGFLLVINKKITLPFVRRFFLDGSFNNPVIFGLIFGLLPCAPLLGFLSYIGLISRTWQQAALYSVAFGAGTFLSPLLAVSLFSGLIGRFLKDRQSVIVRIIPVVCGIIMIILGIHVIRKAW